jgi:hypothetical protein
MFAPLMSPSLTPIPTLRGWNLGLFIGMTGGKRRGNSAVAVGKFPMIPSPCCANTDAWAFWGKPARRHGIDDLALRSAIHNPHALLTLLPNISLSIYKGLP